MGFFSFMKGSSKAGSHQKAPPVQPPVPPQVLQFSFLDKYKLSTDDTLVLTGALSNTNDTIESGKKLTIPATKRHPAFSLVINGPHWQTANGMSSMVIKFSSPKEKETLAACDFSGEVFYIEK